MCLGIPMRITKIDGLLATCEAKGQVRDVKLHFLLEEPLAEGDYLVVERGNALQKVSREEAEEAWAVYDEMLALAAQDARRNPSSEP